MMKRTLLGLLMILFTIITSCTRTIMIIGDSICDTSINESGNIEETIYGRLKSYYEAKGYTVKPDKLVADGAGFAGGYWGLTVYNWDTANSGVCLSTDVKKKDCIGESDADELLIVGLGYNDLISIHSSKIYPDKILSVIQYLKDIIIYAQNLKMHVTFVSHYPLKIIDANGPISDGMTCDETCSDSPSCKAVRNQNYNYYLTQLEFWFDANDVRYIDFFHERVNADNPDDAFVTAYSTELTQTHVNTETGLFSYTQFILDNLDNCPNIANPEQTNDDW